LELQQAVWLIEPSKHGIGISDVGKLCVQHEPLFEPRESPADQLPPSPPSTQQARSLLKNSGMLHETSQFHSSIPRVSPMYFTINKNCVVKILHPKRMCYKQQNL
jgi:hypothetical protein